MLRENIEEQCRKISPDAYSEKSVCTFVPCGGIVGFIDTSGARDGTRGIAFFGDRMYVNTDGELHEIAYKSIGGSHIISSFEDAFADELSVSGEGFEVRISDYSLDKFELKRLLDELCRESIQVTERNSEQAEKYAEIIAQRLAEDAQNRDAERLEKAARELKKNTVGGYIGEELTDKPVKNENEQPVFVETVVDIPKTHSPLPKDYAPAPIPEEKIDWISGTGVSRAAGELKTADNVKPEPPADVKADNDIPEPEGGKAENNERPKTPEVINGVIDRTPMIGTIKAPNVRSVNTAEKSNTAKSENRLSASAQPKNIGGETEPILTESEMRERIENMAPDEMMSFLSNTLNEINGSEGIPVDRTEQPDKSLQTVPSAETVRPQPASEAVKAPVKPPSRWEKLTVEPIWGDIYIKASQSLRQLCESGKLTMEQMEAEIKEQLLSSAEAFERITGDESRVPKVMMPKIAELRSAAENFDNYFSYGEDVAIRAMFFMLYQMLTYADRIAESPETKDRLNDFFRRFGSAGITLSMLDMRV